MMTDYNALLKMLQFAVRDLEQAQALETKGGPRRTQWATEKRESAMLWAWQIHEDLEKDRRERLGLDRKAK